MVKINDPGFHSDLTSILAKTETSFQGLEMWSGGETAIPAVCVCVGGFVCGKEKKFSSVERSCTDC